MSDFIVSNRLYNYLYYIEENVYTKDLYNRD